MSASVYDTAFAALEAGISVFPIRADGTKKPAGTWKDYQERRAEPSELERWFGGESSLGLAFISGRVSGNLEMLEFEEYPVYFNFRERARVQGFGALVERLDCGYTERSPGGGVHWFYRCPAIAGNTKLASRPKRDDERKDPGDLVKVLIETRGEGGYTIVAPSGGAVHPTGDAYEMLGGGIATIPVLSSDEREALFAVARSFDEMPKRPAAPEPRQASTATGDRPGDRWARATSWAQILEPHGWTKVLAPAGDRHPESTYWCRPGKKDSISATTNFENTDLLKIFSTSTIFSTDETYTKLGAFALLNHGGDFAAATRAIVTMGFGDDALDGIELELVPVGTNGAARPTTPIVVTAGVDPLKYPCTDSGNAELLVDLYGAEWRYDHRRGLWMRWAEHWWQPDVLREITENAKAAARVRFAAAQQCGDREFGETIEKFARQSENLARIKNAIELATSLPSIRVSGTEWDADPWLLGCENGVIDLRSGALLKGARDQYVTQHAPVVYDPAATCPRFERFLDEITSGNTALREFIERAIGYTLTGAVREQKFFACYGTGSNGKSTLLNVLQWLLGTDQESGYSRALGATALQQSNTGFRSHDDTLSGIVGKRLVTASELSIRQIDTERVKALTGGDIINTRRMREETFDFRPACKLWLSFNRRPEVRDDSPGFWRRMLVVPFRATFDTGLEPNIEETLKSELPGILAFAVRKVEAWLERGLVAPPEVAAETGKYREESDQIAQFVADTIVRVPGSNVPVKRAYAAYQMWARDQGLSDKETLSGNAFGRRMSERFDRNRSSVERYYVGMEIRQNRGEPSDVVT